jgi:hypothetical protein
MNYELHPDMIRANLEQARKNRDDAWRAFEEASQQVEWWEHGLKLFTVVPGPVETAEQRLRELIPDLPDGTRLRPTLKQAMLLIMRANALESWTVDQLSLMLDLNNWLPTSEPSKPISDMASVMISEGLMDRLGRGEYRLTPEIAAALIARFPPVTDYSRVPAGWPMPSQRALNEGLAPDD